MGRGEFDGMRGKIRGMTFVVEVVDGSHLVFSSDAPSRQVRSEFEVWGLVPESPSDAAMRTDQSVWQHALEAGPLLYVVFQGVVGNAAWEIFPTAGRYLRQLWQREPHELDAEGAAERARAAVAAVSGCDENDVSVSEAQRDGEGVWRLRFALADGRRGKARIDSRQTVTHVKISEP